MEPGPSGKNSVTENVGTWEKGTLVWAKLRGYPYWPALITTPKSGVKRKGPNYEFVTFFASNNCAYVKKGELLKYEDKKQSSEVKKSGMYNRAVALAKEFQAIMKEAKKKLDEIGNVSKKREKYLVDMFNLLSDKHVPEKPKKKKRAAEEDLTHTSQVQKKCKISSVKDIKKEPKPVLSESGVKKRTSNKNVAQTSRAFKKPNIFASAKGSKKALMKLKTVYKSKSLKKAPRKKNTLVAVEHLKKTPKCFKKAGTNKVGAKKRTSKENAMQRSKALKKPKTLTSAKGSKKVSKKPTLVQCTKVSKKTPRKKNTSGVQHLKKTSKYSQKAGIRKKVKVNKSLAELRRLRRALRETKPSLRISFKPKSSQNQLIPLKSCSLQGFSRLNTPDDVPSLFNRQHWRRNLAESRRASKKIKTSRNPPVKLKTCQIRYMPANFCSSQASSGSGAAVNITGVVNRQLVNENDNRAVSFIRGPMKPVPLNLGFVGMGELGISLVYQLLRIGQRVTIWNRTASKCIKLVELGATLAQTPQDLSEKCDLIFCTVKGLRAITEVCLGGIYVKSGIVNGLKSNPNPDKGFVMISTIDDEISRIISKDFYKVGAKYLDAQVLLKSRDEECGICVLCSGSRELFDMLPNVFACSRSQFVFLNSFNSYL